LRHYSKKIQIKQENTNKAIAKSVKLMNTVGDRNHENKSLNSPVISYGRILVNRDSCQVTYDGQPIALHPKEYQLLLLFLEYPHHLFNYDEIIDRLWDLDKCPCQCSIRSHIKGLRKAFKKVDPAAKIVENVHGMGYRLKPLPKTKSTTPIISALPSLVAKLLAVKAIEYLVLDRQLIIEDISPNLLNYCDYPEFLKLGMKVEDAFPELVGLEETFEQIFNKELDWFELKAIGRSANPNRPEYINCYVILNNCSKAEIANQLLFIFFEDVSEQMIDKQRLVQIQNLGFVA